MKQKSNWLKNSYIQIAAGVLGLLILALIPLLLIGNFSHPCADDFTYGYYTHAFWSTTHSLSETLKWAVKQVQITYDTWQGTFSSVFLMALSPAIWGDEYYFLTPVIMLLTLMASHFYFLYVILVKELKTCKSLWCIVSGIIVFVLIQTIEVPVEGLYWFNGAVHYVFMHGIMLSLFAGIWHMNIMKKRSKKILLLLLMSLFSLVCGGANYVTALTGLLGLLCIVALQLILKRKLWWNILPVVIYLLAFYQNVSAPGNAMRQGTFEKSSPTEAIVQSFVELFHYSTGWITIQIILFMLLLIPFFWKMAEGGKYKYPLPGLVIVAGICFVACMFTPGLYSMGIPGAGRTLNIIKMWFLLWLFAIEGYFIGYLRNRIGNKLQLLPIHKMDVRLWTLGVFLLIGFCFLIRADRRLFEYSSYAAYVSLRAGEASQYEQEYQNRLELLITADKEVEVEEFTVKPRLLYFDDITDDPYDWRNKAVANWYGKDSVIKK